MDVSPTLFNGVGVVSIFVWLLWMLASGRLVTRREHQSMERDRDYWRAAAQTSTHTAEKLADQKSASIAAIETIAKTATERGDSG